MTHDCVAPIVITSNRARSLAVGALLAAGAAAAAARALMSHSVIGFVIALIVVGIPAVFFIQWGVRRRPALVIGVDALTEGRSGRVVPWSAVTSIRVGVHKGLFGESHDLVVSLAHDGTGARRFITTNATNPREMEIGLDWLSLPWQEVVSCVERRYGRTITTTSTGM